MALLDDALAVAATGLPVFPCGQSKRPCIPSPKDGEPLSVLQRLGYGHGHLDASTDPTEVAELFSAQGARLIGIPTGERAGYDILDIDYRNAGGTWEHDNAWRIPETRVHRTLNGGRHYLFRHVPGVRNNASKLAPGIDIRGDGGYAVIPPSNGYTVESDADIAEWPDWLLEAVLARSVAADDAPPLPRTNGAAHEPLASRRLEGFVQSAARRVSQASDGNKHFTLRNMALSLGGIMDQAGMSEGDATAALMGALPASAKDRNAAAKTVAWGLAQGRLRPIDLPDRALPTSTPFAIFSRPPPPSNGEDHSETDWADEQPLPEAEAKPERKLILTLAELEELPDPEWLIRGLIPEQSLIVPFGPPKGGKSFIMMSIGLHIAAGRDWFSYPVKAGAVVYIAGEGVGGLKHRMRAMRTEYDIPLDIPFWIVTRAVNFRVAQDVDGLVNLITATVAASRFADVPVVLVVVDTLARAMPGADENSAQEVGLVIAMADEIKLRLSCTVALVHHEGKDETRGARGTSALRGAWDTAFRITQVSGTTKMEIIEQKEAEAGQILKFDMKEVVTGIGRSSLVPVLRDSPSPDEDQQNGQAKAKPAARMTGKSAILFRILERLAKQSGRENGDVDQLSLRREFYDTQAGIEPEAKKKGFQRALQTLQDKGLVEVNDPWIRLSEQQT
jgi:hypothetical protein